MDKSIEAAFCSRIPNEPKAARIASISIDRDSFRLMIAAFLEADAERMNIIIQQPGEIPMSAVHTREYCRNRAAELRGGK